MTSRVRLLDVNVLVALSLTNHLHHETATRWFAGVKHWATCAITQAGYVRLLLNPRVTGFEIPASEVLSALSELTSVDGHQFLTDDAPLSDPAVSLERLSGPKQVTDLHLVDLVAHHEALLTTFDARLPASLDPQDRHLVEVISQ